MKLNKTTKTVSLAVAMFAIVGMMGVLNNEALANPPGIPNDETVVKRINFIARPDTSNGFPQCGNGDNKIWTVQGNRASHIGWFLNTANTQPVTITDCYTESMDGDDAQIELDRAGVYNIYVRILAGAPGDAEKQLKFCIQTRTLEDDPQHQDDKLCLLDQFTVKEPITVKKKTGGEHTKLTAKIFKDSAEEIVYHIDQATKFKHAQLVITFDPT